MSLPALFYFIIHHFLQAHVHNVVVLNCWDSNSRLQFLRTANVHNLRTQFVNLDHDFWIPNEHLDGPLTVLGLFLDLKCSQSKEVVQKSSDLQLFIAKHNWLILDDDKNYLQFTKDFESVNMSIDAQISYAVTNWTLVNFHQSFSNPSNLSFTLYDVYNNGKHLGGKLNITSDRRLTCSASTCWTEFLSDLHLRTKYGHRYNLSDTTFRVSTVVTRRATNLPTEGLVEFLLSMNNSHVDTIARYGFKLVIILQEMMGYKVKYIFRNAWSVSEDDGASFGDLRHATAELSSSPFLITFERLKRVSPLLQIGDFRGVFLFRTPHNEGLYGRVFLSPFSTPVWLVFCLVILVFTVLLWVVFAVEVRVKHYMKFIPSLLSTFLISFGMACVQGTALIPRTTGGRIAFFSLSLVTFIMYNYYTSTVVSSLVGSPVKSSIKSISQLADSSLDVGMEPASYTTAFLNAAKTSDVKKLIEEKLKGRLAANSSLWLLAEEGLLRVKRGGFAYHTEASSAYRIIEKTYMQQELCDLNEVKLRPESALNALLNKNSSYKEIVRLSLLRMLERGVISRHRRFWMKTKLHCFATNILINVGLEYTGPLFAFLGIVYFFVMMVLVFEVAHHRFARRRKGNW